MNHVNTVTLTKSPVVSATNLEPVIQ